MMSYLSSLSSFLVCFLPMVLVVLVDVVHAQETVSIAWTVPSSGDSLPAASAKVGDTVEFTWSGTHNVYIHPSQSCDQAEGVFIGDKSPTTYTFTEADAPPGVYFACHVGGHCFSGQHMFFEISDGSGTTTTTTNGPSASTSSSPALLSRKTGLVVATSAALATLAFDML